MDYKDVLTFDSHKTGVICHYQGKKYELPLDYNYFLQCFKGSENFHVIFRINNADKFKIRNNEEYSNILKNYKNAHIELLFNQKEIEMDRTRARKRSQDRTQIIRHTEQQRNDRSLYKSYFITNDNSQKKIPLTDKNVLIKDKQNKELEEINSKINNLVDRILKLEEEKINRNEEIEKLKTNLTEKDNIIKNLLNKQNVMEEKMKQLEIEISKVKLNITNNTVAKEIKEEPKENLKIPLVNEEVKYNEGEFGEIFARLNEEFNVNSIFTKTEIDNAIMKGKHDYEMVKQYLFYN